MFVLIFAEKLTGFFSAEPFFQKKIKSYFEVVCSSKSAFPAGLYSGLVVFDT